MDFSSAFSSQPRGLHNFISEIRNCKSKEDERTRVDQELANIRQKFSTTANLSSYQKKKYVWKLSYIYMLGYDVDFGHLEFISLISSTKFQEKSVGYLAFSMMMKPGDELMTLVINSIRNDLVGQVNFGQSLALAAVSNIGGNDLAEALASDVQRLITNSLDSGSNFGGVDAELNARNKALVSKKGCLCLLRLFRTNPECVILEEWIKKLARLLEDRDLGVIVSTLSLLIGFTANSPALFEPLVPYVISVLTRLVINRTCSQDYLYYRTPCPWLQVKCLRFLQFFKIPSDATQIDLLNDVLSKILVKTDASDSNNKSNADHSILFEAINLVISYGPDAPVFLKEQVCILLGRFIAVKDANIRYLGLEAMTRLAMLDGPSAMQVHQTTVLESLRDTDNSVRKRALNLVYVLTDTTNAQEIVGDLVTNLTMADSSIKEDMVVKIAILAEKFVMDYQWYVQTMIQVILAAGDFVAEAVWFRIVQIVTNNPDIHEYAAEKLLETVQSKWAHETIVALAAYLLGEIGVNVCEKAGMSGFEQFTALHQHFPNCSVKVQAILLTTYMKLLNLYPEETREPINEVFEKYSTSAHLELQQRACEYLALPSISAETMEAVLNPMPPYELDDEKNILLTIGAPEVAGTTTGADRSVWSVDQTEKNANRETFQAQREASGHSSHKQHDSHINRGNNERNGSGGSFDPVESARKAASPAKSVAKVFDLLSMDDDDAPVSGGFGGSSSGSVGLSGEQQNQVKAFLKQAQLARGTTVRSTLFDSSLITIAVSGDYRAHQGRLALFYTNQSDYTIQNFKIAVDEVSFANIKTQEAPVTIGSGEESRSQIAIEVMRPFGSTPIGFEVSFSVQGTNYKYPLSLPVTPLAFCDPLPSDKPTYMSRWQAITGEGTEVQKVFAANRAVDASLLNHVRSVIVPAMRLGLAEGLDNERTVTGSLSFLTGTIGADGKAAVVGALMRLEGDSSKNMFRITVRSKQNVIATAIADFVIGQLGNEN